MKKFRLIYMLMLGMLTMGSRVSAAEAPQQTFLQDTYVQGMVYLCDSCSLKQEASQESETLLQIPCGSTVRILGIETENGEYWCRVSAAMQDREYEGYLLRERLVITNEAFLDLEETLDYVVLPQYYAGEGTSPDIEQFPQSYRAALYELKNAHPNWVFVPFQTNVDWNYAVSCEMRDNRSLIQNSYADCWKSGSYGGGWSQASEAAVKYCMDPRNWLGEQTVFQFEQLTYNSSYHSVGATQNILQNSFMAGPMPQSDRTYAENFVSIGADLSVSPFHIAGRVLQEQGRAGTSPLISGTYSGYEGYYNYFNIGASGSTQQQVIESGLRKARQMGWTSPYLSIRGGADFLSSNYIRRGQDTLYLQKFDVDNSFNGMFSHQYMQNILAPGSEARSIYNGYQNAGALENPFAFKIPVYQNMPASACARPDAAISSAGIYIADQSGETVTAGLVVNASAGTALEYRWLIYDIAADIWKEVQPWTAGNEWLNWTPGKTGDYLLQGEVRVAGSTAVTSAVTGIHYVNPNAPQILGICQMPYDGPGGGFLIGVETDRNPGQSLQYELLILDCTLLAAGEDPWVWTTGRQTVPEGNAFWAVWQPLYGYYWTYFRVFDENGNLVTDQCYGFANV